MAETASKTVKQRYQEASYLKVSEAFERVERRSRSTDNEQKIYQ